MRSLLLKGMNIGKKEGWQVMQENYIKSSLWSVIPHATNGRLISDFLTEFCYFSFQVATQLSSRG